MILIHRDPEADPEEISVGEVIVNLFPVIDPHSKKVGKVWTVTLTYSEVDDHGLVSVYNIQPSIYGSKVDIDHEGEIENYEKYYHSVGEALNSLRLASTTSST